MTKLIHLKGGGIIKVRISERKIESISYEKNGQTKEITRQETAEIKFQLENIFNESVENFKDVLLAIEDDELFFEFGKQKLDTKRDRILQNLLSYKKETKRRISQMEEELKKFTL